MPPAGGGREDCWSDGGTACLVDAWGDRYVELNRGNLRQKDWSDVADAVNRRQEMLGRPRRTDVQCKNRIDTVKKKYKLEKSKPGPSQWRLFAKLDSLVGPAPPLPSSSSAKKLLPMLTFTMKPRNSNPSMGGFAGGSSSKFRSYTSSESSRGENSEEEVDYDDDAVLGVNLRHERFLLGGNGREKRKWEGLAACERGRARGEGCGSVGQLARAIVNFAEVYERVESAKQQQVMELERHRMEFAKDLEFQRMKMFMEAQLEIEKMKRPKHSFGSGKRLKASVGKPPSADWPTY